MNPESHIRDTVTVELGERSYPIVIGDGLLQESGPILRSRIQAEQGIVITDANVAPLYLPIVRRALREAGIETSSIVVPAGERQKNMGRVNSILTAMLGKKLSRSAVVVALGGGVVGDLAGFVASIYRRGIAFAQIPTTLLAQVDSSVGGKTGVNHPSGKNMIGAFHQPCAVIADSAALATLPKREFVCGLGEVIKYGVIRDESFFSYLESRMDEILALETASIMTAVGRCCRLKAEVVSADERETDPAGGRAELNFGHTVGHAVEAAAGFRTIKHGEAVLIGMLAECRIAEHLGLLQTADRERVAALIERLELPRAAGTIPNKSLLRFMAHDKKAIGKKLRFVLPDRIGRVRIVGDVPERAITESYDEVKKYFRHAKKK